MGDLGAQRRRGRHAGLLGMGDRALAVGSTPVDAGLVLPDEVLTRPGIQVIRRPCVRGGLLLSISRATPRLGSPCLLYTSPSPRDS